MTDSKELCHLHMTNPIDKSLLLEATTLAQGHCLERLEMLKTEVQKVKETRSVPIYLRPVGPRKNGAELTLEEIDRTIQEANASKRKSKLKKSRISTILSSNINILENMI